MKKQIFQLSLLFLLALVWSVSALQAQDFDVVILNGRVMDPETNFDAIRNVGIKDGRIALITEEAQVHDENK